MSKGWHDVCSSKAKGTRRIESLWDEFTLPSKKLLVWKCIFAVYQKTRWISVAATLSWISIISPKFALQITASSYNN